MNETTGFFENETDFDQWSYLVQLLGPQRQPWNTLIPLTCVYLVLVILGIFGNLSVCFVIYRIPSMRSATNYYLFSLAIADLLILLLGLPNEVYLLWQQYPWIFGEGLCKIRALISEMTSYSSVLTIVAFSMERYLAICHPLYSYTMSGLRRASKIIAVVWLLALISAIPYAIFTNVEFQTNPSTNETIPESAICTMLITPPFLVETSFLLFFLIPMTIMIILYIRMGLKIRRNTTFGENRDSNIHGESRQAQSRRAILRMLASVVLAFFICWAPFHAQRLLYVTWMKWKFPSDDAFHLINEKLFYISGCFYYLSSTVNPILYNVMSAKYRNAFKETLCGRPRINSVYIPSKTDIQIPNNGANIQNGLDRNGRQRLHLQASAISASEVKVSSETVVLLNGQDNDFDRNKTMDGLSLTVTTLTNNGVSDQVEREVEMAEIHSNQKPSEECKRRILSSKTVSFEEDDEGQMFPKHQNGSQV